MSDEETKVGENGRLAPLERQVRRKPKLADVLRLDALLKSWREEEANLFSHYGKAIKGTTRNKRIKDADALDRILALLG